MRWVTDANLHDLIHAFTEIKKLELDEARIRVRKRRLFCVAFDMIDRMAMDDRENAGQDQPEE